MVQHYRRTSSPVFLHYLQIRGQMATKWHPKWDLRAPDLAISSVSCWKPANGGANFTYVGVKCNRFSSSLQAEQEKCGNRLSLLPLALLGNRQ
jgi:hypothetical protein